MAAKKHSKRTTTDKTTKERQTKDATDQAVPAQSPTSAVLSPVDTAEAAGVPTVETTTTETPMPAEMETLASEPTLPNQSAKVKQLSALDAAARVLGESGQAMNCQELIATMAAKGYWSSPKGKTPAGTLYTALTMLPKT